MEKIIIDVYVDNSCEMARVHSSTNEGMEGNFWDFHPGCHGITKFGEFNSYMGFANAIAVYYIKSGHEVEVVKHKYKYE